MDGRDRPKDGRDLPKDGRDAPFLGRIAPSFGRCRPKRGRGEGSSGLSPWRCVTQGHAASPPRYCPSAQVSRAEMAIFLLRARHGGSYVPPPATGTRFNDVVASDWAASWIEQLATEGITNGCAVNLYCPGRTVARAEMAVFLARAFNLLLP